MRALRVNGECFTSSCLLRGVLIMVLLFLLTLLCNLVISSSGDCGCSKFIHNFCEAVKSKQVHGGACDWICSQDPAQKEVKRFYTCPRSTTHLIDNTVFLLSNIGPAFAMSQQFFQDVIDGYTLKPTFKRQLGETMSAANGRSRELLINKLNTYLNQGSHDAILNSLPRSTLQPVPEFYTQSMSELLSDRRFLLSLLFYGTGERPDEPPSSATESIPAVSLDYTCAALYQVYNLANHTTRLSDTMAPGGVLSFSSHKMAPVYLYQVLAHLIDIEETVSEHGQEGEFYLCNLNTSQILLHNNCVRWSRTANYKLSHPCDIKILDISQFLFSEYELSTRLSQTSCTSNKQCRYHACHGECNSATGTCQLSPKTRLSGLLQVCHFIRGIEDQVLEGVTNKTTLGRVYDVIDRCVDLKYYPLAMPDSPDHLIATYNVMFQELKLLIIDMLDTETFALKAEMERVAAEKERKRLLSLKHKPL